MPLHSRVYTTEAIVLRRTDFGEADRILTLFTPTYGKVRAVAKGVRRTTSRLAGHLEPFTRTQLLLATGRDLDIVTQAEARERLDALRGDLWHATGAWYAAELAGAALLRAAAARRAGLPPQPAPLRRLRHAAAPRGERLQRGDGRRAL